MSNDHSQHSRRMVLGLGSALGLGLMLPTWGGAADARFPSKPLQIIVPYPPGGSNDKLARLIGQQLARKFGQPVVVDNRPGASGMIGAAALAKSTPDGHTLALVSSSFATSAAVQSKLPFDPLKDFEPVARISSDSLVLLVSRQLGVQNLQGLIALARQRPRGLTYGSSGIGSVNHFAAELFMGAAGISLVHVPYRGMTPALTDLTGGHLDMVITSAISAHAFLADRKILAIATTGAERLTNLNAIPTCRESGLPGFVLDAWAGFLAPAGTPTTTVALLNSAINDAMRSSDLVNALAVDGSTAFQSLSSSEFRKLVQGDLAQWRSIAKAKNISAD